MSINIRKELYWVLIILLASYVVVSINSSFDITEKMQVCPNDPEGVSKIAVILQLTVLLTVVKILFNMVMKMEKESVKFFLIPIVLFALPVSAIILWLQLIGC